MKNEDFKIILVEDNEGHAELIKIYLKKSGLSNQIHHFKNGAELLDFLYSRDNGQDSQNHISYVLLLDIRMPKVDGIEVLRKLKNDEKLKKIPVIMLTTTEDPSEIDNCYSLGCNNYITKPIEYEEFSETLKTLGDYIKIIKIPEIQV